MSGATARAPEDEAAANGLATKADLANLKAELKDDRKELKADVLKVATIIVGALASVGIITVAIIGLVQLLFG